MSQWYVITPVGEVGPLSKRGLKKLADEGKLAPDAMVRSDKMKAPVAAHTLKGLIPNRSQENQPQPSPTGAEGSPEQTSTAPTPISHATDDTAQSDNTGTGIAARAASSVAQLKGAASAVKEQAEIKRIELTALPKARRAVGAKALEIQALPAGSLLPDQITTIERELAALQAIDAPSKPSTLTDKAKRTADDVKKRVQTETLNAQKGRLVAQLGAEVCDAPSVNGIPELRPLIDDCELLNQQLQQLRSDSQSHTDQLALAKKVGIAAAGLIGLLVLGWATGLFGRSNDPPLTDGAQIIAQLEADAAAQLAEQQRQADQWQQEEDQRQAEYERQREADTLARIAEEQKREQERIAREQQRALERKRKIEAKLERERQAALAEQNRIREEQERVAAEEARIAAQEQKRRERILTCLQNPDDYLMLYREKQPADQRFEFVSATTMEPIVRMPYYGNRESAGFARITNAPNFLYETPNRRPQWGFARDGVTIAGISSNEERELRPNGRSGLVSADYRRVLKIENGDIWKAEFDWQKNQLSEFQRLTDVQACDEFEPKIWSGNFVYFDNPANPRLPSVRINLATGEIDERRSLFPENCQYEDDINWTSDRRSVAFQDPTNRVALIVDRESIVLKDLQTDEQRRILNLHHYQHDVDPNAYLYDQVSLIQRISFGDRYSLQGKKSALWLDDANLAMACIEGLVVLNVPSAKLKIIQLGLTPVDIYAEYRKFNQQAKIRRKVGDRLWVTIEDDEQKIPERQLLVDTQTGTLQELPNWVERGFWLNDQYVIQHVAKGGLSELGHWLHDYAIGEKTRITARRELANFRSNGYRQTNWFFNEPNNKLFFRTESSWHVFDTKTKKSAPLPGWEDVSALLQPPSQTFDLGFDADSAWAEAPAESVFSEPQLAIPVTDNQRVAQLLEQNSEQLPPAIVELCLEYVERMRRGEGYNHPAATQDPVKVLQVFLGKLGSLDQTKEARAFRYDAEVLLNDVIKQIRPMPNRLRAWTYRECIKRFVNENRRKESWATYTPRLKSQLKPRLLDIADRFVGQYRLKNDEYKLLYKPINALRERFPKEMLELKAVVTPAVGIKKETPHQAPQTFDTTPQVEQETSMNRPPNKALIPKSVPRKLTGIYKRLMSADRDGDQRVTLAELTTLSSGGSSVQQFFDNYDKNRDGYIDRQDFGTN